MGKSTSSLIIIFASIILSVNAIRTISESYNVGSVYIERKKQTQRQYLEVIKKKNELDYINSPFFVEKQLRESLNYYRYGEKLLVFTRPIITDSEIAKNQEVNESSWKTWVEFLKEGITSPN